MIFALFVLQLALVAANPFHKYPYVFLLDIGNEELEKTNTEQIRISIPGGSLALRYPAIGDGETIAHVRVSGLDFGTELKANVVDGGPGYKYVVLVLIGNNNAAYDAILTIQTVSDNDLIAKNDIDSIDLENANDSAEITDETNVMENNDVKATEDANDSSEDTSDDENISDKKSEVVQESSDVYSYAKSDYGHGNPIDDDDDDEDENNSDAQDIDAQKYDNENEIVSKSAEYDEDSDSYDENNANENETEDEQFNLDDKTESENIETSNLYDKYSALRPNLYGNIRVYPQNAVPFTGQVSNNAANNPEDSIEFDQTINNEEIHNQQRNSQINKYSYDSDDSVAVAS